MLGFIRRWYYENKDTFWIIIIVAGLILLAINVLNNYYKNEGYNTGVINTNVISTTDTINNEITGELESSTSLITGAGKNKHDLKEDTKIIDDFINKCNNGQIQEAYDLLTEECKEEVFPNLNSFKNKYYNNVFNTMKTYSIQNWVKDTYKVMIKEDVLSTGKITDTYLQEYMTVVSTDNGDKLNINNYIGRTVENKVTTKEGLEITFIKKDTYMNYERYTIQVKNLTDNEIILDEGNKTNTIYLKDENDIKQYADTENINYENLKLMPRVTREYTFKFSNTYSSKRIMKYLIFESVLVKEEQENNYEKILVKI